MALVSKGKGKVIDYLVRNFSEKGTIRKISRETKLSLGNAHKILKALEKEKLVLPEKIGTGIFYKLNLDNELAAKMAGLILAETKLNQYAKVQAVDLLPLKEVTDCAVLFGSVIEKGKEARDIDILLVFEKHKYSAVMKILNDIKSIKPKKMHEMIQTKEDLARNIKKRDAPLLSIIRTGQLLWGSEVIVGAIKNGTR